MIHRRPSRNQRRKPAKNLLEVSVRAQFANKQRNRRIAGVLARVVLVFAVIGGMAYGAKEAMRRLFWENPKYDLAVVEVRNPGGSLEREVVLAASKLKLGESIFSIDLSDAREALTALPRVEAAELRRVLPNKVTIDLTERRPVAWLAEMGVEDPATADSSFLIDAEGNLFRAKERAVASLRLPVIYGVQPQNYLAGDKVTVPELEAALELICRNGEIGQVGIRKVDLSKGYCMLVTDIRGRRISFPFDKADYHLDRLAQVLEATTNRGLDVQTVNLLVEKNVPVTLVSHTDELPPAPEKAVAPVAATTEGTQPPAESEGTQVSEKTTPAPTPKATPKEPKESKKTQTRRSSQTARKATPASSRTKKPEVRRATPVAPPTERFIPRAVPVHR